MRSSLVPGEAGPGLIARIAGLPLAAPADILRDAPRWAEQARAAERYGAQIQVLVALGSAASNLGEHQRAVEAVQQARALLDDGISPEPTMYCGAAWIAIARVLYASGQTHEADAALSAGVQWVQRHAVPHVPPQFLDSFLHRNPHNRELLARRMSAR
jgi:tetratricopeptide (TPR) repeat protein